MLHIFCGCASAFAPFPASRRYALDARHFPLPARWILHVGDTLGRQLPRPTLVLPECSANCVGSPQVLATINVNIVTASVLVNTVQPNNVPLTINGAPAGS